MCVDRNGEWLYVVETWLPGVSRIQILDDGSAGERQVVTVLPDHMPDGVQFDEDDVLHITMYTPDRIYRMLPDGHLQLLVDDPTHETISSPTNIVFGGADRRLLLMACLGRWQINGCGWRRLGFRWCIRRRSGADAPNRRFWVSHWIRERYRPPAP